MQQPRTTDKATSAADPTLTERARAVLAKAHADERSASAAYERACAIGDNDAIVAADRQVEAANEAVIAAARNLAASKRSAPTPCDNCDAGSLDTPPCENCPRRADDHDAAIDIERRHRLQDEHADDYNAPRLLAEGGA